MLTTEGGSRLLCPVKNDRLRQRKTASERAAATVCGVVTNWCTVTEQSAIYRLTTVTNLSSRRRRRCVSFRFRCVFVGVWTTKDAGAAGADVSPGWCTRDNRTTHLSAVGGPAAAALQCIASRYPSCIASRRICIILPFLASCSCVCIMLMNWHRRVSLSLSGCQQSSFVVHLYIFSFPLTDYLCTSTRTCASIVTPCRRVPEQPISFAASWLITSISLQKFDTKEL